MATTLYAQDEDGVVPMASPEFVYSLGGGQPLNLQGLPGFSGWRAGAMTIVVERGYLASPEVLYCPDNGGYGSAEETWPGVMPGEAADSRYWSNYAYVGSPGMEMWLIAGDLGHLSGVRDQYRANTRSLDEVGLSIVASDYSRLTLDRVYNGNHEIEGGNTVFNDGHAAWADRDEQIPGYLRGNTVTGVFRSSTWLVF